MKNLKSIAWWEAAGTRSIKTFSQSAIATIGGAIVLGEVNWAYCLSASLLAALLSLLMSLSGLPEIDEEEE